LWYPAKSRRATDTLARHVAALADEAISPGKCLRLEFSVAPQVADGSSTTVRRSAARPR